LHGVAREMGGGLSVAHGRTERYARARRPCIARPDASHHRGARPSDGSVSVDPHAPWLAGVWGEPSPQVPPTARWTAGRGGEASQPWAEGEELVVDDV